VLARELELLEQLGEMAADPNIQRELKAINEESAVTELDGLAKLLSYNRSMPKTLETPTKPLSFTFDKDAALAATLYIVGKFELVTANTVFAMLYLADKKHLEEYGRFITGDRYFALEPGPVPSHIYDVLNYVDGQGEYLSLDENFKRTFKESIDILEGHYLSAKTEPERENLSESDLECLADTFEKYNNTKLENFETLSHDTAWQTTPRNHEISIEEIVKTLPDSQQLLDYLRDPFPEDA
jgi:Protein of unknown function (DUF4065)